MLWGFAAREPNGLIWVSGIRKDDGRRRGLNPGTGSEISMGKGGKRQGARMTRLSDTGRHWRSHTSLHHS